MHVLVEPLSQLWWGGLLSSSIVILLLLLLFKKPLHAYQLPFMKTLSVMLVFSWIYGALQCIIHYRELERTIQFTTSLM